MMMAQTRGYGISFFLHLSIVALIIQAAPTITTIPKPLLIDFTLVDSLPAPAAPKAKENGPKPLPKAITPPPVLRPVPKPPPKVAKPKPLPPKPVPEKKIIAKQKKIIPVAKPVPLPEPVMEPEPVIEEEVHEQVADIVEQENNEFQPPPQEVVSQETSHTTPLATEKVVSQLKETATSAQPAAGSSSLSQGPPQPQITPVERYTMAHFKNIRSTIQQQLNYPMIARKRGWQGTVILEFLVCPDGRISDIKVVESSGHKALDKNAVATIKAASPFPVPPVAARLKVPVVYRLS